MAARTWRSLRNAAGLTQRQLALKARCSDSMISRLERDQVGLTEPLRQRLAAALGVPEEETEAPPRKLALVPDPGPSSGDLDETIESWKQNGVTAAQALQEMGEPVPLVPAWPDVKSAMQRRRRSS